jgi:putative hydrolase of HD superfamily
MSHVTPLVDGPAALIQRQLEAYNDKDVEAWLATYAPDAEQYLLHGDRLAKGHDELRTRILTRFAEPDLHARLINRTVMGSVVVDLEQITRNFPEGRGTVDMLCIYEVAQGRIVRASFAFDAPVLTR